MFNKSVKQDNLDAFERLLELRYSEDQSKKHNYRYYEDLYGNKYIRYTHRQDDGKFHAEIWNKRTRKTRKRYFAKMKSARKWLSDCYIKARNKQKKVLDARKQRKQEREALKPKLTTEQKAILHAQNKIKNFEKLITKADSKIKAFQTRKKTYMKKIKYHKKRIVQIQEVKSK